MANNKTSCPKDVCEKIFRAITFGPAFTTIRRVSSRQPTPSPTKHADAPNPYVRTPTISKEGAEVPIKFNHIHLPTRPTEKQNPKPTLNGATQTNGQLPVAWMPRQSIAPKPSTDKVQSGNPIVTVHPPQKNSKHKVEESAGDIPVLYERPKANEEEDKKPTQHHGDRFSEFIQKTKERMSNDEDHREDNNHRKHQGSE